MVDLCTVGHSTIKYRSSLNLFATILFDGSCTINKRISAILQRVHHRKQEKIPSAVAQDNFLFTPFSLKC